MSNEHESDWQEVGDNTVNHLIFVAVEFRDFSVLDFSLQEMFADFGIQYHTVRIH